jgi:hypothetical protein
VYQSKQQNRLFDCLFRTVLYRWKNARESLSDAPHMPEAL